MREEAFLEAIRSSPEDNILRLVYADWLEEYGDGDRDEFIRLQVALDKLPACDVRHFCANLRLQEIIANHPERWDDDLPLWARKVSDKARYLSYRRGMPAVIRCDVKDWLEHGDEVLAEWPIERVEFSWYKLKDRLQDWLDSPLTEQVKHFDISGQYLSDQDLRTIETSQALAHVETLILAHNSFGDEGAIALAATPYLVNLQELDLSVTNVGPAGFRAITQSRSLPKLRRLKVGHNHSTVGDTEMRELEDSPHHYEEFIAYGTSITDKGVAFLRRANCMRGLRHLDLGGNAITGSGAEALANCDKFQNLEILELWNTQIGDVGATAIGQSPYLTRLRYLNMLRCGIGPNGGADFARAPTLHNLLALNLSHNACGDDLLATMAETTAFRSLIDLQIHATSVTSGGITALVHSSCLNRLIRLHASANRIDDRGAVAVAQADCCKDLRLLVLHANQITDNGAKALAASGSRQIRILHLGGNLIEDSGALAFLNSLPADCNLVLHGNPISDDAWQRLEKAMGDRFLLLYDESLLSIPQRTPNPHTRRTDT